MSAFEDVYPPSCMNSLEKPVLATPRWDTTIQVTAGGNERRNQNWSNPLWSFTLPEAARMQDHLEQVLGFWLAMGGPYKSFPWRNPVDFASTRLPRPNTAPAIAGTDQPLGTGDGVSTTFQLSKVYTYLGLTYVREIHLPILASVIIAADGVAVDPGAYTISRPGGVVTFGVAPDDGAVLTSGFLFDHEVRFAADDAFQAIVRGRRVAGFSDVNLEEVRPC